MFQAPLSSSSLMCCRPAGVSSEQLSHQRLLWSSDYHDLLQFSRSCDDSRESASLDPDEKGRGAGLPAFLKDDVANNITSDSSTGGHDDIIITKIKALASDLSDASRVIIQPCSGEKNITSSCWDCLLEAFSSNNKIATMMPDEASNPQPHHHTSLSTDVGYKLQPCLQTSKQLLTKAVTSGTQTRQKSQILRSYQSRDNIYSNESYDLSGVNHRRLAAKRNTSASTLLHLVPRKWDSLPPTGVTSTVDEEEFSPIDVCSRTCPIEDATATGRYGTGLPEPTHPKTNCSSRTMGRPQLRNILKPLAKNTTPFELSQAGNYLGKPTAKANGFLLKNAGALSSNDMPSALSLDACTNGWPLTTVCMWIFQVHDVLGPMHIKFQTMEQFLLRIEAGYLSENGYHNRAHAADVTLRMYALLQSCFDLAAMPRQAACSLLLTCTLAAAIHDFMHPGSNNQYQAEVDSEASRVYNGKSVIENFSISSALDIARHIGLFSDMPRSSAQQICKDIVDIVLASDMIAHFDVVSSFKSTVEGTKGLDKCNPGTGDTNRVFRDIYMEERETRMVVLKMAMKIADLGHCYLPWAEHLEWVERLQEEFFTQGDTERAEALLISPMMDRSKPGVGDHGNSIEFYRVFVMPMLEAWTNIYPTCLPFLEQARSNLELHMMAKQQA